MWVEVYSGRFCIVLAALPSAGFLVAILVLLGINRNSNAASKKWESRLITYTPRMEPRSEMSDIFSLKNFEVYKYLCKCSLSFKLTLVVVLYRSKVVPNM